MRYKNIQYTLTINGNSYQYNWLRQLQRLQLLALSLTRIRDANTIQNPFKNKHAIPHLNNQQ